MRSAKKRYAIFLCDDKMVITFNYKEGTTTITFADISAALRHRKLVRIWIAGMCQANLSDFRSFSGNPKLFCLEIEKRKSGRQDHGRKRMKASIFEISNPPHFGRTFPASINRKGETELSLLHRKKCYVFHHHRMPLRGAIPPPETRASHGRHVLDHLAADGAGLTGGDVAVVAVLEVDAHLVSGLHLEAVHGLTGLGNHDLVVAACHSLIHPFRVLAGPRIMNIDICREAECRADRSSIFFAVARLICRENTASLRKNLYMKKLSLPVSVPERRAAA